MGCAVENARAAAICGAGSMGEAVAIQFCRNTRDRLAASFNLGLPDWAVMERQVPESLIVRLRVSQFVSSSGDLDVGRAFLWSALVAPAALIAFTSRDGTPQARGF